MYRQLIISSVLIYFVTGVEQNANDSNTPRVGFTEMMNAPSHNVTYIDKAENMIRLPTMNKYYEENKMKRMKKLPKRTIQKIIKKNNRSKVKRVYVMKMTSHTTVIPKVDYDNIQEDISFGKDETTTHTNQKKKLRKYNTRLSRYPMPFHQMITKKTPYKRNKREIRDRFIFKDLDEMQFIKEKKDYNIVNAHMKKYW